jgi:hypothetical protein
MARAIDDLGHIGRATKPLGLRVYEPGSLPDPSQCTLSLIAINDRSDGVPRARLAFSNGASWDLLAFTTDAPGPAVTVDVRPMIERAVAERLPALIAASPYNMHVISPPASSSAPTLLPELAQLRADNHELVQTVLLLGQRLAALEERLAFVEHHGAATTAIEMRVS